MIAATTANRERFCAFWAPSFCGGDHCGTGRACCPETRLHRRVPAGILTWRDLMVNRRKLAAALLASLVGARPRGGAPGVLWHPGACGQDRFHACCAAMSGAPASSPKGAAKVPTAPKPETSGQTEAPLAAAIPALTLGAPELASVAVPAAVSRASPGARITRTHRTIPRPTSSRRSTSS